MKPTLMLRAKELGRHARKIADRLSAKHGTVVVIPRAYPNPTLVAHGLTPASRWHLITHEAKPRAVADLYVGSQAEAARIGRTFANLLGVQLKLLDNAAAGVSLHSHRAATITPNPPPMPRKQRRARASGQFAKAQHYAARSVSRGAARFEQARAARPRRRPNPKGRNFPKVRADSLQVGDVVMPPEREVRLWMTRAATEKGMKPDELGIMLTSIREGASDKNGRWLLFKGYLRSAWYKGGTEHAFTFKARPETLWPLVARPTANHARRNPGGPRIVYNRLLGGWYVVVGPQQTPLDGRFDSKAEAQAWLSGRRGNPKGQLERLIHQAQLLWDRGEKVKAQKLYDQAWKFAETIHTPNARHRKNPLILRSAGTRDCKSGKLARVLHDYLHGKPLPPGCKCVNPARGRGARHGRQSKRLAYRSRRIVRAADARARAMRAGGSGASELARFSYRMKSHETRKAARRPKANPTGRNWSWFNSAYEAMKAAQARVKRTRRTVIVQSSQAGHSAGSTAPMPGPYLEVTPSGVFQGRSPNRTRRNSKRPKRTLSHGLRRFRQTRTRSTGRVGGGRLSGHRIPVGNPRCRGPYRRKARRGQATAGMRGRNPARAAFTPGEHVSVPYTGRSKTRTSEHATVLGETSAGVHVQVRRGKKIEEHYFAPTQVRRLPARGERAARARLETAKARIELKSLRSRVKAARAAALAATHESECAEAQAKERQPYAGETPTPEYRRALARMNRARREAEAQGSLAAELDAQDPRTIAAPDPFAIANPRLSAAQEKAARVVRMFQDRGPLRIRRKRMKAPAQLKGTAAELGKLEGVIYSSDKFDGKNRVYEHEFQDPKPSLVTDPEGKGLHIAGGKYVVTADGIVN